MYALLLAALLEQMQTAAPSGEMSPPPASAAPADTATSAPAVEPPPGGGNFRRLPVDIPNISPDDAVIRNSGSTNTTGYTIVVHPDYSADVYSNGATVHKQVDAPQAKWLFEKLKAAMPLAIVGAGRCMKSASFGTYTTIRYGGQATPDLSCGGGPVARELMRTVGVIVNQLGVSPAMGVRRRML